MSVARKAPPMKDYANLVALPHRDIMSWNKIVVGEKMKPSEVLNFCINKKKLHVIQESSPYFENEVPTAATMLCESTKFFSHPVSSILKPESACSRTENKLTLLSIDFEAAIQKVDVLDLVERALVDKQVTTSIRSDAVVVSDELITNAIFNAPFVDLDNNQPGARRGDATVRMHEGKNGRLFIGVDNEKIVVGCSDPYGTLNVSKLLARIQSCYDTSVAANIRMTGGGGAGIGSFMMFNAAASFYLAVNQYKQTVVACVLPLRMSSRARLQISKNLHVINKV